MGVYVRPFRASDLGAFEPIEPLPMEERRDPKLAKMIEQSGLAVTGIRNDEIIGCGGAHPVSKEQGELWLRLSPDCFNHPIDTVRWIRDGLEIIEQTFPFKQLNAVIQCGFKSSIRLVEWLGFKQTQILKREGKEYLVYSKMI